MNLYQQVTYWAYRDGVPVKRTATRAALDEFCDGLRVRYPGSHIRGKYTMLQEQELFYIEPQIQYQVKETNDA
jgi:hypothetical protein